MSHLFLLVRFCTGDLSVFHDINGRRALRGELDSSLSSKQRPRIVYQTESTIETSSLIHSVTMREQIAELLLLRCRSLSL